MDYFDKEYFFECLDHLFTITINAEKKFHDFLSLCYETKDIVYSNGKQRKEFRIRIRNKIKINSDLKLSERLMENVSEKRVICNLSDNIWIDFTNSDSFQFEYNIYYNEINRFSFLNIIKSVKNLISLKYLNELILLEVVRISTIYPISAFLMSKGNCILLHASSYIDNQENLNVYQGFDGCGKSTTAVRETLASKTNKFYSDNFLIVREDGFASSFKEKARLAKSTFKLLGNVSMKSLNNIAGKYLMLTENKRLKSSKNTFPIKSLTFLSWGKKHRTIHLNTEQYLFNVLLMYNLLPEFSLYRNYYELITSNIFKNDKKVLQKILNSIKGEKVLIINQITK